MLIYYIWFLFLLAIYLPLRMFEKHVLGKSGYNISISSCGYKKYQEVKLKQYVNYAQEG